MSCNINKHKNISNLEMVCQKVQERTKDTPTEVSDKHQFLRFTDVF